MSERVGTAVVLGGSVSGLMAAAALRRRFARVVIVERDSLAPAGPPAPRKGVGQGRHNHNVTPRATRTLARLFPGLLDTLRARGASVCDAGGEGRWILAGSRIARVHLGEPQILATRPLLDAALLDALRAAPRVEVRDARDVCGLVLDPAAARVRGVRLLARADGREEVLEADLVVDASGRGSRVPRWLAELGFDAPPEEHLEVDVHYTTRVFRRAPGDLGGDRYVYVSSIAPMAARGGVGFAVEGDRWMVLLFEYGARPPSDLPGFRRFASELGAPDLAEIAGTCEPLGDAERYAFPRSTRRRYDLCARLPRGLLAIGDALQSTNPSWGLGITSAAIQIDLLERWLARAGGESARFFRDAIRASEAVWGPVTIRDREFQCVSGELSAVERAVTGAIRHVIRAAARDQDIARVLLRIVGQVTSPLPLLRPDRLARVALAALRGPSEPALPARRVDYAAGRERLGRSTTGAAGAPRGGA